MAASSTEEFLKQCREYLSNDRSSLRTCAQELKISPTRFLDRIRQAYRDGLLVLRGKVDKDAGSAFTRHCLDRLHRYINTTVLDGEVDDETFAYESAGVILRNVRELLENPPHAKERGAISLGLVSGTSVCRAVEKIGGPLWDDVMAGLEVSEHIKAVNVLTLSITPLHGDDFIEGNASNACSRLAAQLKAKLPRRGDRKVKVDAFGLGLTLVVPKDQLEHHDRDPLNKPVIEIADPERLAPEARSQLDLVVFGVGPAAGADDSVFMRVITDQGMTAPEGMCGDLAFFPLRADGEVLDLKRKTHEPGAAGGSADESCVIYTAILPRTLKRLAEPEAKARVILIARNHRRGKSAAKTGIISAALGGGYVNALITDKPSVDQVSRRMFGEAV